MTKMAGIVGVRLGDGGIAAFKLGKCLLKITVIYPNKFGARCLNLQLQGNLPGGSAFAHAWVAHNQIVMGH